MDKSTSLFRAEALAARYQRTSSGILVTTPPSAWITGAAAILIAATLLGIAGWGELTRTVSVSGTLVPEKGIIRVVSPQIGVVVEKRLSFGATVEKGEPLYRLSSDRHDASGSELALKISQSIRDRIKHLHLTLDATRQLQEEEKRRLTEQRRQLAGQIEASRQQISLLTKTVEFDGRILKRKEDLRSDGWATVDDLESAQRQLASDQTQISSSTLDLLRLQQTLAETDAQIRELPQQQDNQTADILRQLAQAEADLADNEMRREIVISSPENGTVSADMIEAGQTVAAGTPMAVIAPRDAPLEAHLLAPSSGVGFLREGQRVSLRYQAFPYQKFGLFDGEIKSVSRVSLDATEMEALKLPTETNESFYRVTVRLPQQAVATGEGDQPLRAGMLVDADIGAETRRVWEWIFEPLYSMRGSLMDGKS